MPPIKVEILLYSWKGARTGWAEEQWSLGVKIQISESANTNINH